MSIRVPKYRLHRASNQALVEIHGRRIYLGKYDSPESREKYRELIARLMSADPAPVAEVNSTKPFTIDELVLKYFRYAKQYYRKNGRPTGEVAGVRVALRRLRRLYGGDVARGHFKTCIC
jgi:hypothetical protein